MSATSRCKFPLSLSGLSIALALGLALWEGHFFFVAGTHPWGSLEGSLQRSSPQADQAFTWPGSWVDPLTYQLISIPFALPAAKERFIGVVDGMASLVLLAIVLVVVFGKPHLLGTTERQEAAILLMFVNAADLFGGYAFNIALSRRIFDVSPTPLSS